MKNNVRKKPTNREMASAIIEINSKVNECMQRLMELDTVLGMYIKMNKHLEKFNSYIEEASKKRKEESDESKGDGKANNLNLQGDTDGERSRTEGIRQEGR